MAYCLSVDRPVSEEFSRLLSSEAKSAAKALSEPDPTRQSAAVHQARKAVKKLRALLRLAGPNLKSKLVKAEDRALQKIGRSLSELRDAEALLETFNNSGEKSSVAPEDIATLRRHLRQQSEELLSPDRVTETLESAGEALRAVAGRSSTLALPDGGIELLLEGLEQSYRQGRKAMRHAWDEKTAESIHTWRKRAKDHWYHTRLLSAYDPDFWQKRAERLEKLSANLGDAHNLAVLGERLATLDSKHSRLVRSELKTERKKLEAAAFEIGREIYRDKHLAWSPTHVAAA